MLHPRAQLGLQLVEPARLAVIRVARRHPVAKGDVPALPEGVVSQRADVRAGTARTGTGGTRHQAAHVILVADHLVVRVLHLLHPPELVVGVAHRVTRLWQRREQRRRRLHHLRHVAQNIVRQCLGAGLVRHRLHPPRHVALRWPRLRAGAVGVDDVDAVREVDGGQAIGGVRVARQLGRRRQVRGLLRAEATLGVVAVFAPTGVGAGHRHQVSQGVVLSRDHVWWQMNGT